MGRSLKSSVCSRVESHDRSGPSGDAWEPLVTLLRREATPVETPAFAELYLLALAEGRRVLRSFRTMDEGQRVDLALDLLLARLPEVLRAERPRAYYRAMVRHAAVSWKRSPRSRQDSQDEHDTRELTWVEGALDDEEVRACFRLDAREAFDGLSPREREVLVSDASGDSRESIAARLGTTRANVDQIISRARRRSA